METLFPKILFFVMTALIFPGAVFSQGLSDSYEISFPKFNALVKGYRIACPEKVYSTPLCLGGSILLDPGHDDQSDSKRNIGLNFNEGRSNMLVALLVRDLLIRCSGLVDEQVNLIRWPGEEFYNEYQSPKNAWVSVHQPGARLDGLQSRVEELSNRAGRGISPVITLSLHSNSSGSPKIKPDRVEIFYPENAPEAWIVKSTILKESMVNRTIDSYQGESKESLKKIRQAIRVKSFVQPSDFSVLTKTAGPESMMKLIVEMFYMDSSQRKYLDRESDLNSPETKRVIFSRAVEKGYSLTEEIYPVTRLQSSSALGIYEGLTKMYSCESGT